MKVKAPLLFWPVLLLLPVAIVLAALHFFSVPEPVGSPRSMVEAKYEKEIAEIQLAGRAYHAEPANIAYKGLFSLATAEDLEELTRIDDHGIAMRAMWKQILFSFPEKKEQAKVVPINKELAQHFVGFVEGRLRTSVPHWWKEAVVRAWGYDRTFVRPSWEVSSPYHKTGLEMRVHGIQAPNNCIVTKEHGDLSLKIGHEVVHLPAEVAENLSDSFSGYLDSGKLYAAVHSWVGEGYVLYCIDRSSAKVLWESWIWASGWSGSYMGDGYFHWVDIRRVRDHIIVFGLALDAAYIEAFDCKTGKNIFRFGTLMGY